MKDLIQWENENLTEPILTKELSHDEIDHLIESPMIVPSMPVHGQAVERCVKEVTAASMAVYGNDRRDGFIRARLAHRGITGGTIKSKRDHALIVRPGT